MTTAPSRRVFISDVHLAPEGVEGWFNPEAHTANLLHVLQDVLNRPEGQEVKDLVFLGNLFETWVCPIDRRPDDFRTVIRQIYAAHRDVFELIRECVARVPNVFFLNGNHDMLVDAYDLEPLAAGGRQVQYIQRYLGGLLHAEHGHRFGMFNAKDRIHDRVDGLPIGYFLTRALSGRPGFQTPQDIFSALGDILESSFDSAALAESVVSHAAVSTQDGLDSRIRMHRRRRDVVIADLVEQYAALYDRWVERFGQNYALRALQAELGSLSWFGDRLANLDGYKVVVMGHTHGWELTRAGAGVTEHLFANSGAWCTSAPTFVEVDKLGGGSFDVWVKGAYQDETGQSNLYEISHQRIG